MSRPIARTTVLRASFFAVFAAVAGWIDPLVAAVLMPLSSGLVIASAATVERAATRLERT